MERLVLKAINELCLLPERNITVTVALSGGADSMAMLRCLLNLKEELSINVEAAHLNHQIRGEEALRDEKFVTEVCERWGVALHKKRADIPKYAQENSLSVELAAREVRYEFLREVNKGLVATAHNAGDNLETMLFNLTRGTGLDGLCGIPPKRDIFIRPLIYCSRSEIEAYCQENNISYVTDSTNLSDEYTRNKIRHNVATILREINPNVDKSALRTALSLREDSQVLHLAVQEYLSENITDSGLKLDNFKNLPKAIAKRIIKTYIEDNFKISLEAVHISSLFSAILKKGRTGLPGNLTADAKHNILKIYPTHSEKLPKREYFVKLEQKTCKFSEKCEKINNLLLNNLIDCDKIVGKLVIRTRKSDDSIRLLGRNCTKPLTKHFTEKRVPVSERDNIPIIADDKGVVWVYGLGVAQRCAVKENTMKVIEVKTEIKEL